MKAPPATPAFPISNLNHNPLPVVRFAGKGAYWTLGAALAAAALLSVIFVMLPQRAVAFWFFSNVSEAAEPTDEALIHDSSLDLLEAAVNSDPNPNKGSGVLPVSGDSALVAYMGPEGTIADIDHTTSSGRISTYVVRPGDTLSDIATMFDVSGNTILWANNLTSKTAIHPGMVLTILPVSGVQHTVLKGETLAGLAKKFSADAADIASFNGLDPAASLVVGSLVIIPGGEIDAPAPAKSTIKTGAIKAVNAYKGGSGNALPGFFSNPVPGALLTQGIHGWNGVDIGAKMGTPVHAAAGGTVIVSRIGGWNGGYGNYVVIDHGNGTQTLYGHLTTDNVSVGQTVAKGSVIGTVGNTGKSTGYHLHFEVRGAKNPFANCALRSVCSF